MSVERIKNVLYYAQKTASVRLEREKYYLYIVKYLVRYINEYILVYSKNWDGIEKNRGCGMKTFKMFGYRTKTRSLMHKKEKTEIQPEYVKQLKSYGFRDCNEK